MTQHGYRITLDTNLVHEARLAHIGEATQQQCPSIGVYGWHTRQMLSDLLQIQQTLILPLHYGAHTTQGGTLQLLASIEGVAVLHQARVIPGNTVEKII